MRGFYYAAGSPPLSRERLRSVRRSIEYTDTRLSEPLRLADIGKIAGMSPNYFSALFHSVSGITLWDYINSRRVDKAIRHLFEKREADILDIALPCGFNNTANFNKAFKKVTGMTPSEYRAAGMEALLP